MHSQSRGVALEVLPSSFVTSWGTSAELLPNGITGSSVRSWISQKQEGAPQNVVTNPRIVEGA